MEVNYQFIYKIKCMYSLFFQIGAVAPSSMSVVEMVSPEKTSNLATRRRNESRKLDGVFCIARMMVSENLKTGVVNVDYVSTHTGHKPSVEECKHIPLPTSLRKEVQEKFAAGITIERIMDGK